LTWDFKPEVFALVIGFAKIYHNKTKFILLTCISPPCTSVANLLTAYRSSNLKLTTCLTQILRYTYPQALASMTIKRFLAFFPILTVWSAIVFPLKAIAQTETVSPFIPSETPVAILNRTCNFLKAKQAFTVDVDITYDNVFDSGAKIQFSAYQ
jgi:hypothetical protein